MSKLFIGSLLFYLFTSCGGSRNIFNESASETIYFYQNEKGWDNGFIFSSVISGSLEIWTYNEDSMRIESYSGYKLKESMSIFSNNIVTENEILLFEKDLGQCQCLHCETISFWYSVDDSLIEKSWPTSSPCISEMSNFNSKIAKDFKSILNLYYSFNSPPPMPRE